MSYSAGENQVDELTVPDRFFETDGLIDPNGVVLLDDIHQNDYAEGNLDLVKGHLESIGYVVKYASEFTDWREALSFTHHLIMTAPYTDIPQSHLNDFKEWLTNGSRNVIISSRGDFNAEVSSEAINSLLSEGNSTIKVNDDNVYTTNPAARRPWYIETDNFNSNFESFFTDVNTLNFFSPSSIIPSSTSSVIVYGESDNYQSDENPPEPEKIFDDTDDGTGGDTIPLAVFEQTNNESTPDRFLVLGSTLWSDFDYGDSSAQDTIFLENSLKWMTDQTRNTEQIIITLLDTNPPTIKVVNPRNNSIVKGEIPIKVEVRDPFGVESLTISLDGTIVSNTTLYLWDTTKFTEGVHTINITATDFSGNSFSAMLSVKVEQGNTAVAREPFKVMAYNIKESGIFPQWIDVVKEENPDILLLVETGDFDDNGNQLLNEVLNELNLYFIDFLPYAGVTTQNIVQPYNGITLLSRFEIVSSEKISSVTLDDGRTISVPLPFLSSKVKVFEQDFWIIGGHLSCCPGADNELQREQEQEGILNYMDSLGNVPIIYLGDMNSNSPVDNATSDLGTEPIDIIINPANPKTAIHHEFVDVYQALNPNKKEPTYLVSDLESRIDFIFVNQWFPLDRLINSTIGDTPSAKEGSDHASVDAFIMGKGLPIPQPITHTFGSNKEASTVSNSQRVTANTYITVLGLIAIVNVTRKSKKIPSFRK